MLKESEIKEIKKIIENSENPIIYYDNDADGLCSYLLYKKHFEKGTGIRMANTRTLGEDHLRKARELGADLAIMLDIADIPQDFIDGLEVPVLWIDHHPPIKRNKVQYFNPRIHDPKIYISTSTLMYQITKKDIWLAAAGAVSDWEYPSYIKEFDKEYPGLVDLKIKKPDDLLYKSKLGDLIAVLTYLLKGLDSEVRKSVAALLKINDPYEILEEKSEKGKFLKKRAGRYQAKYKLILERLLKEEAIDGILVFYYQDDQDSFTFNLANESSHKKPKDFIIVAREKSGEIKMSIRWQTGNIKPILEKALAQVNGFGGGHEHACGAVVKVDVFDRFLDAIKEELAIVKK
jgi:single-stranded DNA-specific DHH superfamily exonuclease